MLLASPRAFYESLIVDSFIAWQFKKSRFNEWAAGVGTQEKKKISRKITFMVWLALGMA